MRGSVEISVRGENAKVVEIIRRSTVVPDRVLELPEIVECGDLFQVDLKAVRHVRMYIHTLEDQR